MRIAVVEGDLLEQAVEAIVNPWNQNVIPWWLLWPRGVSGAIRKRAGVEPFKELRQKGRLALGEAVCTSAGKLPFKVIIHVASIDLKWHSSEDMVQKAVGNAIAVAEQEAIRSVAFPLLGAGSGRLSPEMAQKVMVDTLAGLKADIEVMVVRFRK
jgi:O-acetyl-ADP-ribose deacetylase